MYGDRQMTSVLAFTAHGPYVLMQNAKSTDGLDAATALIGKAIDLQRRAIDRFKPTDPAAFATVPVDPSGLLARTVPEQPVIADINPHLHKVYDRHGALHFQRFEIDPVTATRLFADAGVDLWATSKTSIYQARDAAGAARLVEQFVAEIRADGAKPAEGVAGMPASRCLEVPHPGAKPSFACFAPADRYAIEAHAGHRNGQLLAAQQQVAAQYVMLTTT
jgi:hypothetical protein